METAELLVNIFDYPLWFAKLLAEHFPPSFTITEEMEENWAQIIGGHLSRAKEKIITDPNMAGFLEPCLLESQLLAFAESAGANDETDLVNIHAFFCSRCLLRKRELIVEQAILEGIASLRGLHCPPESVADILFGHVHQIFKNPDAPFVQDNPYKRINYPEFMILAMDHINHCDQCRARYELLQREREKSEEENDILERIETQFKNSPPS